MNTRYLTESFMRKAFQPNLTKQLGDEIRKCNTDEEFERIMDTRRGSKIRKSDDDWRIEFMNILRSQISISDEKISEISGVSINTVRKWRKACPKKCFHYIRIGCIFGLGTNTTSRIMQRYGGYRKLDAKNPEDIISIRLLNLSERPIEDFNNAEKLHMYEKYPDYEYIKDLLDKSFTKYDDGCDQTARLLLSKMHDDKFHDMYNATNRFRNFKSEALNRNLKECLSKIGYDSRDKFLKDKHLHEMYSRSLSGLDNPNKKVLPSRDILITLFLHMGLPLDIIDKLLEVSGSEPLCARNPYESALIYILTKLYKNSPDYEKKSVMLSKDNLRMQTMLSGGSLYNYVYNNMNSGFIKKFLEDNEVDIDSTMCKGLVD